MDKFQTPQIVVEKSSISNPAPLGLAAFAVITFITSVHNAGESQEPYPGPLRTQCG